MFAIHAENLSKEYELGGARSGYDTLRDDLVKAAKLLVRRSERRRDREKVWALRDVSLEVGTGEVVGLVGRNGAGKTTLLKVLSRITEPTSGYADIRGRVGSLLEVGAGFHRELTGRENIFLNGAILGMGRGEIRAKLDEIADFAGVERFLDTPVKYYSSGMYLRLAFAVAAHLEPEVLLVDEVLAVGDAEFQRKCLGKMQDVTEEGRTVLFVSHNLAAIRKLCPRTIWIDQGRVAMDAETDQVLAAYLKESFAEDDAGVIEGDELRERAQSYLAPEPLFQPTRIALSDADGLRKTAFRSDEEIVLSLDYEVFTTVMNLRIVVSLVDEDGRIIMHTENLDHPSASDHYMSEPGSYSSECVIKRDLFGEQRFWIDVDMICENVQHVRVERGLHFDIAFQPYNENFSPHVGQGFLRPQLTWQTEAARIDAGSTPADLRVPRAQRD
jgi:lipopolysaccharide transport system ATP-binding protein